MGVYLLLAVGATTALTEATAACGAWPLCGGGWTLPSVLDGWVAVGHRLVAVVVGLLLLTTTVVGWRTGAGADRRVRLALLASLALYPVQAGLGAFVATSGADPTLSTVHLAVAMAIFGGLVLALAWNLESETGDPDDAPTSEPTRASADSTNEDLTEPSSPAERPAVPTGLARVKATAWAYFRLTKPRLMWLLCLVAGAAMALAGGPGLTLETVAATLGGGALSIGASGTFNHVLERDVDRKMNRTSDRPLALDLVPVRNAVAFGVVLAAASLALFASVNLLAAALGLAAILFYSVVYTLLLKPNTVQNTVLGGAAGALPALIGWVAVTGEIGLVGLALAGVIFLWTPAHFYNLALAYKDDYERGGFPMMPVVRGETATRRHILYYLGATLLAAGALATADKLGTLYVLTGVALGAAFLWAVVRLHYEKSESAAFRSFHASNAYLGALLLAIVVDALAV
ncbi:heme o synthase [Halobium salinum]|uniref:Protoheme IX farnesyltransferase n=1 Tax=Halobium salinum TaxID=1364940 RepID=A0ABD5P7A2_9EURY|nr:heme o synthase [Halobium salinum]